jgi:hypothetical protein
MFITLISSYYFNFGGGEQIFLVSSLFAVLLEDHTKQQVLLLVMLCTKAFS